MDLFHIVFFSFFIIIGVSFSKKKKKIMGRSGEKNRFSFHNSFWSTLELCGAPRIALTWFASYIYWSYHHHLFFYIYSDDRWKAGLSGGSLPIAVNFGPLFILSSFICICSYFCFNNICKQ